MTDRSWVGSRFRRSGDVLGSPGRAPGDRQLTRIFKTELGTTPHAYVESARVERAANLLETTDDTLERVASGCGFGTVDTLIRAFRRRHATTPSEYRARFRTAP